MNEGQLVKQVLSGNTSAFEYFVVTYQDMALNIAFRICGNIQDAEDIVQESYMKAYRNLHSFRSDSKFSTWLYRIVYNTSITYTKSQMWLNSVETSIESAGQLEQDKQYIKLEDIERAEIVSDIMQKIPKGDALLLTLYYMEDNSIKDIAKITGLNESNVKVKLFRARKIFKELLISHYQNEAQAILTS